MATVIVQAAVCQALLVAVCNRIKEIISTKQESHSSEPSRLPVTPKITRILQNPKTHYSVRKVAQTNRYVSCIQFNNPLTR